jgi:hypothetical protein
MSLKPLFINGLEQMTRRKLVIAAGIVAGVFLLLFALICGTVDSGTDSSLPPADAAMAAIFLTLPAAGSLCAAFLFILGSSVLPEEISAGRAGFWAAQPVSRTALFAGFTLPCLAVGCVLSIVLFGGIEAIVGIYLPYSPHSVLAAAGSLLIWASVLWAAVVMLSLMMNRIVAIILCFCMYGLCNFLGGLAQMADAVPEGGPGQAFRIAGLVSALVFPSDPPFRTMMFGLMPTGASVEEALSFMGVGLEPPTALTLYALAWSVAMVAAALLRFRRLDLK